AAGGWGAAPVRRADQRAVSRAEGSGVPPPGQVLFPKFLHRPRLSRSGLRQFRYEDHVLYMSQERIQVFFDGSLKPVPEPGAKLVGIKESLVSRDGIDDEAVLSGAVEVDGDWLRIVHRVVREHASNFF